MASRHRWTYPLACPVCHTTGQVTVSEDPAPPFVDLPTRTYTITEGFRVRPGPVASAPAHFECAICGAAAD
jgi:hypothetical protein